MTTTRIPHTYRLELDEKEAALLHHFMVLSGATYRGRLPTAVTASRVIDECLDSVAWCEANTRLFGKLKAMLDSMEPGEFRP